MRLYIMKDMLRICEQFDIKGRLISIDCHGSGNINKTFMATYEMENGEKKNFIFHYMQKGSRYFRLPSNYFLRNYSSVP